MQPGAMNSNRFVHKRHIHTPEATHTNYSNHHTKFCSFYTSWDLSNVLFKTIQEPKGNANDQLVDFLHPSNAEMD